MKKKKLTVKDLLKSKSTQPHRPVVQQKETLMPDLQVSMVAVEELVPWEDNPRINDEAAVKLAEEIQRMGFRVPIVATSDGTIRAGHTRLKAAMLLGLEKVPVLYQDFASEEEAQSFSLVDNRIAEESKWDPLKLRDIMNKWEAQQGEAVDLERMTGFTQNEIAGFRGELPDPGGKNAGSLAEKFLVPPFTVLDARQGYWKKRKNAWFALGIQSELGREDMTNSSCASDPNDPTQDYITKRGTTEGGSVFDPVLCELVYRWFCPVGGVVLDQFAGGSVRGIVAGKLGLKYIGIDLSKEQVEANRQQADNIFGDD